MSRSNIILRRKMKGDVTTFDNINGFSARDIERRIGYEVGRLREGYMIFKLIENVKAEDFIWSDATSYSGGFQYRREVGEYVHRSDILREAIGRRFNFDEALANGWFKEFFEKEINKLNERNGAKKIVKVVPVTRHLGDREWYVQYPNARVRGVNQWTLVKKNNFELISVYKKDF